MKGVKGIVSGRVQMVGFRRFVQGHARRHDVSGYANNRADGRVEVLLYGDAEAVRLVQDKVEAGPTRSTVDRVEWSGCSTSDLELGDFTVGWSDPD